MASEIEDNDVSKVLWENLSDSSALDAGTKTSLRSVLGLGTASVLGADGFATVSHGEIAIGSSSNNRNAYLDEFASDLTGGVSTPIYLVFSDSSKNPINVYTDEACTTPATIAGDLILGLKDPVSGRIFVKAGSPTPTLQFDADDYPLVRMAGGYFVLQGGAIPAVTSMWAVSKKNAIFEKNGLVGRSVGPEFWGLWDVVASTQSGFGYAIGGIGLSNGLTEAARDTAADDESLSGTVPRLHTGFILNGRIHYSINGRVWKSDDNEDTVSFPVDVIGRTVASDAFAYNGDLYGVVLSEETPTFTMIDEINLRLGILFNLPITSSYRRLIVVTGTSMEGVTAPVTANNAWPDILQRTLGKRGFAVENVAIGGWTSTQLLADNRERLYGNPKPKVCLIGGLYNEIAGDSEARNLVNSLITHATYYQQLKALGFHVVAQSLPYRTDLTGVPNAVSNAEFAIRVDAINELFATDAALGVYHDGYIDFSADDLLMDSTNTDYRPDAVHGSLLWNTRLANTYVAPYLTELFQL